MFITATLLTQRNSYAHMHTSEFTQQCCLEKGKYVIWYFYALFCCSCFYWCYYCCCYCCYCYCSFLLSGFALYLPSSLSTHTFDFVVFQNEHKRFFISNLNEKPLFSFAFFCGRFASYEIRIPKECMRRSHYFPHNTLNFLSFFSALFNLLTSIW